MDIRRLTQEDLEPFKKIRFESLKNNPISFGASFEEEEGYPDERFVKMLNEDIILGCFEENELIGVGGLFCSDTKVKRKHKGFIWGMYVKPEYSGRGFGRKLIEELVAGAPSYIEQIQITVMSGNERAEDLYKRQGFEVYGHEKESIKVEGQYYDEIHMVKFL